ncbi:MAG TPA: ABC transporter ATP-binding protein [Thermoanaerobaculia bacterium]|jgi:putative ABC transport system ATP-binding protein|nr:ABC transporter ATP-binding protein [Thermoanaerobaculia bacterium]
MIELKDLAKTYRKAKEQPVKAIDHVSLKIEPGELVAILGPSGSGKSTLMNVMGLLDRPDSGEYLLNGRAVNALSDDELAGLRNRFIGFVFQAYHLLPRTTAVENVQLPLLYADRKDYKERSEAALAAVGLSDRKNHFAEELSGGQQQRVAIARAIVNEPSVLLADEPTGNLDSVATGEIIELFKMQSAKGTTVVLITHDHEVAQKANRIIRIRDGAVEADERNIQSAGGAL